MTYILYDIVIGVILLLFALRGRRKGLVLALCSLAAIITAFIGASYAADLLTPKAAEIVVPKIASVIERRLEDLDIIGSGSSNDGNTDDTNSKSAAEGYDDIGEDDVEADNTADGETGISNTIREAMSALKLPSGMLDSVETTLGSLDNISELPSVLSSAIASAAADTLLHLVIFIISFILILLLWRIIGHALDLIARLPVLHFLNKTGGFILGLCKGIILLFVLAWILRYLGNIVPDDAVEHTYLLHFFMTTDPLEYIAGM